MAMDPPSFDKDTELTELFEYYATPVNDLPVYEVSPQVLSPSHKRSSLSSADRHKGSLQKVQCPVASPRTRSSVPGFISCNESPEPSTDTVTPYPTSGTQCLEEKIVPTRNLEETRYPSRIREDIRSPSTILDAIRSQSRTHNVIRSPSRIINDIRSLSRIPNAIRSPSRILGDIRSPSRILEDIRYTSRNTKIKSGTRIHERPPRRNSSSRSLSTESIYKSSSSESIPRSLNTKSKHEHGSNEIWTRHRRQKNRPRSRNSKSRSPSGGLAHRCRTRNFKTKCRRRKPETSITPITKRRNRSRSTRTRSRSLESRSLSRSHCSRSNSGSTRGDQRKGYRDTSSSPSPGPSSSHDRASSNHTYTVVMNQVSPLPLSTLPHDVTPSSPPTGRRKGGGDRSNGVGIPVYKIPSEYLLKHRGSRSSIYPCSQESCRLEKLTCLRDSVIYSPGLKRPRPERGVVMSYWPSWRGPRPRSWNRKQSNGHDADLCSFVRQYKYGQLAMTMLFYFCVLYAAITLLATLVNIPIQFSPFVTQGTARKTQQQTPELAQPARFIQNLFSSARAHKRR